MAWPYSMTAFSASSQVQVERRHAPLDVQVVDDDVVALEVHRTRGFLLQFLEQARREA
jgi:hypothetical protein